MMKVGAEIMLTDWIAEAQFWPKRKPFFEMEQVEDSLRIPIAKMGSILKFFADSIKKSTEQNLEVEEKVHVRKQEKLEKPKKGGKKIKNLD